MEKYFQGPKGMDGKFQSLAFPIWDVSIWNCSFFCFTTHHPSWRKPLTPPPPSLPRSSFAAGESCSTRWCLERSPVAIRRNRVLDEDSALLWTTCGLGASVGPLYLLKRQIWEMLHGFKDLGSCAESHMFFGSSKIWFLFSPRSDSILCYFQDALKPMTGCGVSIASFTSFHESRRNITSFLFQLAFYSNFAVVHLWSLRTLRASIWKYVWMLHHLAWNMQCHSGGHRCGVQERSEISHSISWFWLLARMGIGISSYLVIDWVPNYRVIYRPSCFLRRVAHWHIAKSPL